MSKFHSTISRREFMKALGLAGAGLGAAAAAAPVFHDLDELISAGDIKTNPWANFKRPWWVTEREFKNPTTEVDWSIFQTWDHNYEPSGTKGWHPTHARFIPELCTDAGLRQRLEQLLALKSENSAKQTSISAERFKAGTPGWALRDRALSTGAGYLSQGVGLAPESVTGPTVTTPEAMGVPKWTGTPEEATNMLRAAAHMYGSPSMGVVKFDADTKKIFYPTVNTFEDCDIPYADTTRVVTSGYLRGRYPFVVIPNKCQWGAYFPARDTDEMVKRDHSSQRGISRYFNMVPVGRRMQRFILALGYMAPLSNGLMGAGMNVPMSILCGLGELCRIGQTITPEWGSFAGMTPGLPTDLPLAPTKPIDAGIWKFCETCKICADICQEATGSSSISLETEPTWEIDGPWNRVGVKKYHHRWPACGGCGVNNCSKVCPFNTHGKGFASAHEVIKATVAAAPIFNSFFHSMQKTFYKFQPRDEEDFAAWWDRDLNAWPYDTILGAGSGPNGGR